MTLGKRTATVMAPLALASAICIGGTPAAAAQAPLSPANFDVAALCAAPAASHSACLSLGLVARSPLSLAGTRSLGHPRRAFGGAPASATPAVEHQAPLGGLAPENLRSVYGLAGVPAPASTQTIGIVDAFDDPNAEADLARFDTQYHLPECTQQNGCFRKVNQKGNASPLPTEEPAWALEIATDIETAHAVCPGCHILLVEANSNANEALFAAENTAASLGADEISNSWGGRETSSDSAAFNHPGIVITAASGDYGYLNWLRESEGRPDYPASSPHVLAVGGTRLLQRAGTWESEAVWNDGGEEHGYKTGAGATGSGCSVSFTAPLWQSIVATWPAIGCGPKRAVADVSADADPYTGVNVYDSTGTPEGVGWTVVGGTSVASPIIASVFALGGGAHGVAYPARTLYENAAAGPTADLHDVSSGSNGKCTKPFNKNTGTSGCTTAEEASSCKGGGICVAAAGYDGPSGVGTPDGIAAFQPPGTSTGARKEQLPTKEGAGAGSAAGAGTSPRSTGASAPPPPVTVDPPATVAAVSALALTPSAVAAIRRARPPVSRISFAFTLSAPARISATLARWTRWHRRGRWRTLGRPRSYAAAAGRERGQLRGRRVLWNGRYRLTVTPLGGLPVSIVFRVG
jgi:hypothetical protein